MRGPIPRLDLHATATRPMDSRLGLVASEQIYIERHFPVTGRKSRLHCEGLFLPPRRRFQLPNLRRGSSGGKAPVDQCIMTCQADYCSW